MRFRRASRVFLTAFTFFVLSLSFQNCSKTQFTEQASNAVTESSTPCVPGSANCIDSSKSQKCVGVPPANADKCPSVTGTASKDMLSRLVYSCSSKSSCEYTCAKNFTLKFGICVPVVFTGCTGSPQTTQTLACPWGQTGAITQTRTVTSSQCLANNSVINFTYSAWTTTSNTCATAISCTQKSNVPLFGDLPQRQSGNACVCDISSSGLTTAALNAKGLYDPVYDLVTNKTTVVDSYGKNNPAERSKHTLVFSSGNTCELKCTDPDMVLSTDSNGKIICSACKIPAEITSATTGYKTTITQAFNDTEGVPSFIKNNTTKECIYSAFGFTSKINSAPNVAVTTKTLEQIIAVESLRCETYDRCDESSRRVCIDDSRARENCQAGYTSYCRDSYEICGEQGTSQCYSQNLAVYHSYKGTPVGWGAQADAHYLSCERRAVTYCFGLGCNYGVGGGSGGSGGGSGGGFQ